MSKLDNNEQEVISLDLTPVKKRKISIDGDAYRILELNTTDIGLVSRLNDIYPKLRELENQYGELHIQMDEEGNLSEDSFSAIGEAIKDIDTKMRAYIDELFDGNVSEMCAPSGTMFDPINGAYRFEYIIDALSKLYEVEIAKNIEKRKEIINGHASKYKGKRRKDS